jgi:hypothetical protein
VFEEGVFSMDLKVREAEILTDMQAIVLGLDLNNRGFLKCGFSQSAITKFKVCGSVHLQSLE